MGLKRFWSLNLNSKLYLVVYKSCVELSLFVQSKTCKKLYWKKVCKAKLFIYKSIHVSSIITYQKGPKNLQSIPMYFETRYLQNRSEKGLLYWFVNQICAQIVHQTGRYTCKNWKFLTICMILVSITIFSFIFLSINATPWD